MVLFTIQSISKSFKSFCFNIMESCFSNVTELTTTAIKVQVEKILNTSHFSEYSKILATEADKTGL